MANALPVIYLMATRNGGLALIVDGKEVFPIWLDQLTSDNLRAVVQGRGDEIEGYIGAYLSFRRETNNVISQITWISNLEKMTQWLWEAGMGHVVGWLCQNEKKRAILIPSGLLALLPLHAAWYMEDDQAHYAMEDICFSYAPSIAALRSASEKAGLRKSTLLTVNSLDPKQYFSPILINLASNYFDRSKQIDFPFPSARKQQVLAYLDQWLVHFSCHGNVEFANPLRSSLLLPRENELLLADILTKQLINTRLAVLSACETGVPGARLIDEVISLPSALIQAGFAGVIASMWLIDDRATTLLLAQFYKRWFEMDTYPAEALRQSQIWLKQADKDDIKEAIAELIEIATDQDVKEAFRQYIKTDNENNFDFTNPCYWAAFAAWGL